MLETSLGMSVRNDIAPALGPEALFSLNSLTLNPMVLFTRQPTDVSADLLLGVQIRDEAKAGALMKTIEDRLSQQLAPLMAMNAAPAAAPAPASEVFKAEMYNGVELRTVQLPMLAGWSPGYAFHGNFLLIGTTTANLKAAIDRKGGTKPSAASNAQLAGLRSQFGHSAANGVALLNTGALVAKIREIAMPMIQMQAAANPNQAMAMNGVFDVLATFGTLASSARWTGASMHKVSEISLVSPAQ
jgi:hypothetical protein